MDEPLTLEELEQIAARAETATAGPWEAGVRYDRFGVNEGARPGEGPFSFLPVGRCFFCAESGEAPVGTERDLHGSVYHVHRMASDPAKPASGGLTISSAATRQPVVESYEGMISVGIRPRDAEFIASARRDVPRLVAEVKRLREALETLGGLQRSAEAVRGTMAVLREESQRLHAQREETLAALQRTRDELRRAAGRAPAGMAASGGRRGREDN